MKINHTKRVITVHQTKNKVSKADITVSCESSHRCGKLHAMRSHSVTRQAAVTFPQPLLQSNAWVVVVVVSQDSTPIPTKYGHLYQKCEKLGKAVLVHH